MTDLADEAHQAEADRAAAKREAQIAEVRRERDTARHALAQSEKEREQIAARLALVESIADLDPNPPKWLTPKRKPTAHHATITTILSDLHLDEVVNPDEIGGVNAYNRDIAEKRLRRFFDQAVMVTRTMMAGVTFDGAVCMLAGDLVSGDIHEELRESNEAPLPATVLHWSELIAAGIDMLADEFGKVHVPVVVGNHGRRTRKPRAKGRVQDNWDWLLCQMVAREFRNDPRVTFAIPDSWFCRFPVYGTRYHLEHGDQATGGSGWMGPLGPIMRRHVKVEAQAVAIDQAFDHMVVGHYHTYVSLPRATMNGSLKGYDEYAAQGGFGFEEPMQALWLTTPERGIVMRAPVFVAEDRKVEGW